MWQKYMKSFYERYCNVSEKVQRCVALLSWRKNILLLEKALSDDEVLFYATESVQKKWNKGVFVSLYWKIFFFGSTQIY